MPAHRNYAAPERRILWVDDRPQGNASIVERLECRGVHVSIARSTGLALALLARNSYRAVISDMGRREGDREGMHLLDAMRARGDATPFLLYAGLSAPALRDELLLHDGQGSTNDPLELLAMVEAIVGRPSMQARSR